MALILECLASGMSSEDIDEAFDRAFPHEALPEVLKVASELAAYWKSLYYRVRVSPAWNGWRR